MNDFLGGAGGHDPSIQLGEAVSYSALARIKLNNFILGHGPTEDIDPEETEQLKLLENHRPTEDFSSDSVSPFDLLCGDDHVAIQADVVSLPTNIMNSNHGIPTLLSI